MLDGFLVISMSGLLEYQYVPFDQTAVYELATTYLESVLDSKPFENTEYKLHHFYFDPFIFILIHHISNNIKYVDDVFQFTASNFPSTNFDTLLKQYLLAQEEKPEGNKHKIKKTKRSKVQKDLNEDMDDLNFSKASETKSVAKIDIQPTRKQLLPQTKSYISSWINKLSGQQRITDDDLATLLIDLEQLFVKKNIAQNIANELIQQIRLQLKNKQVGRFQSIWHIIQDATNDYLTRLLIPKQSTDLLTLMRNKPFVLAFIGVNGVGKTTNLAKICYWLLIHKKSILIAACDTFRSGAVEQLAIHVDRLSATFDTTIELFQQGYKKDAAAVAKDAIGYAKANSFDVVLIDTAGRMQDDEPLMRSLGKLVQMNPIDKIVFVGEALVGNECIEQLTKFNNVIKQRANRQVDYILLTKFDTVDDLVGAAINMVYLTKQPILFVGVGQEYQDICELDVASVVASILK
eukprot:NODE_33_length_32023_cov_0.217579.p5 type:complete len:463 gc:universal NODE_33_length_32023_cov_0.217579:21052-22440(+)